MPREHDIHRIPPGGFTPPWARPGATPHVHTPPPAHQDAQRQEDEKKEDNKEQEEESA